ncbi:hypothetical protein [Gorillibacterium timonense]|uniref:hypothetical protein n=1 Tax=Gorillibacterium timonense TaxID=1689269 RepID=UPI00071E5BE8|nr:hypothetical protein [Gorillibacterium timonense]
MSIQLVLDERKMQLGSQMFHLVSSKVLMLLDAGQMDARTFANLLKEEGIVDLGVLREGFLKECAKHRFSLNEAEYLFSSTRRLVESKMI